MGIFAICLTVIQFSTTNAAPGLSTRSSQSQITIQNIERFDAKALRLAILDLSDTFGSQYPNGQSYLQRLNHLIKLKNSLLNRTAQQPDNEKLQRLTRDLEKLRTEALLANTLLDFNELVLLKRARGQLGLPVNHKCNSGLERTGYDNELAILSPLGQNGKLRTLFKPQASEFVGEIELHWDGDKLLFTMPKGKTWRIFEIGLDGKTLRQVSRNEYDDVDNFDGCYLPDGRIVFTSTASYHAVPCWHGIERACSIYLMDQDGGNMRQLCFDQDLDLHPSVLPTGQVIFSRWDYSGTMHIYLRPLMVMNPDGTGQRAIYGSNSYWPNSLYFPRGIPGSPDKIIAILSGYHGVPRMGGLVLIDTSKGSHRNKGVIQMIPGRGKLVKTEIKDKLVDNWWPKFLHPYPLSEKYFLVSCQPDAKSTWGIYLVDVFDNMLPVLVENKYDFFEPVPVKKRPKPPAIPDRVDLTRDDAVVYLHDVYEGPGLTDVPPRHDKEVANFSLSLWLPWNGRPGQGRFRRTLGGNANHRNRRRRIRRICCFRSPCMYAFEPATSG